MNKTGDLRIDEIMPQLEDRWLKLPFEACLQKETARYKKLKKRDFGETGKIHVVDQGERLIAGYTDDQGSLYQGSLPVVVFGDHTRRIKYIDFPFAVGADGTKLLHPIKALSPRFFYFYMRALSLESQGYSRHYRFLKHIEVPVPPLNEQHRIVAKLEKLLAKVDKCKERLDKIPGILKHFRQSVLAAACSGELTERWRQENNVNDACEILRWLGANRIRKQILPVPVQQPVKLYGELPAKWCTVKLENIICDIRYGTAKKCTNDNSGLPVLRIPNVVRGVIDQSDMKYSLFSTEEYEKLKLEPGDILLVRSNGSISLVGRSAVVTDREKGFLYAGYLIRIRFNKEAIDSNFVNLVLSSYAIRLQIEVTARPTSGVNNINSKEVRNLLVPLPPLEEQREIVRLVTDLFQTADQVENHFLKAKHYVDKTSQSILSKAFRGELVPQNPNDEPASELLKRIKSEREESKNQQRTTRKKSGRIKGRGQNSISGS